MLVAKTRSMTSWARRSVAMVAFMVVAVASIATSQVRDQLLTHEHSGTVPLTPTQPRETRQLTVRLQSTTTITDAGPVTMTLGWWLTEPADAGMTDAGFLPDGGAVFDDLQVVARFATTRTTQNQIRLSCAGGDCTQQVTLEFEMTGQGARPVEVQYSLGAESPPTSGAALTVTEP